MRARLKIFDRPTDGRIDRWPYDFNDPRIA